ncbi:hypothetical protein [Peribacillus phoenicis]|uniref:hypothetical protein n=1 Tax=unclassified Peribacillus TaxID=2675266 RepID=UPI00399F89DF
MKNKDSSTNWTIVTTQQICEIIGLKPRRIQQLANEGALVRVGHGKFDLPRSVGAYVDYQVSQVRPAGDEEIDNSVETALWTRARKEKTELEVQIIKGELHRSSDVERVMNDMLLGFKAKLTSLPTKMAPQLVGKTEIPVVKDLLKEAVYEALNELSDYDPQKFYDYSTDKMFLGDEEEEDMLETEGPKAYGQSKKKN